MIVESIVTSVISVIAGLFNLLPDLPDLPSTFSDNIPDVVEFLQRPMNFLKYIYGDVYFSALIVLLVLMFNFQHIFHFSQWILRKLPIGSH